MLARRNKTLPLLAGLLLALFTGSFVLAGAYHQYCHRTHAALHETVEQLVGGGQLGEAPRLAIPLAADGGAVPPSPVPPLQAEDFTSGIFRPPIGPV